MSRREQFARDLTSADEASENPLESDQKFGGGFGTFADLKGFQELIAERQKAVSGQVTPKDPSEVREPGIEVARERTIDRINAASAKAEADLRAVVGENANPEVMADKIVRESLIDLEDIKDIDAGLDVVSVSVNTDSLDVGRDQEPANDSGAVGEITPQTSTDRRSMRGMFARSGGDSVEIPVPGESIRDKTDDVEVGIPMENQENIFSLSKVVQNIKNNIPDELKNIDKAGLESRKTRLETIPYIESVHTHQIMMSREGRQEGLKMVESDKIIGSVSGAFKNWSTEYQSRQGRIVDVAQSLLSGNEYSVDRVFHLQDSPWERIKLQKVAGPEGDVYLAVDGTHRIAGAKLAELKTLPAEVEDVTEISQAETGDVKQKSQWQNYIKAGLIKGSIEDIEKNGQKVYVLNIESQVLPWANLKSEDFVKMNQVYANVYPDSLNKIKSLTTGELIPSDVLIDEEAMKDYLTGIRNVGLAEQIPKTADRKTLREGFRANGSNLPQTLDMEPESPPKTLDMPAVTLIDVGQGEQAIKPKATIIDLNQGVVIQEEPIVQESNKIETLPAEPAPGWEKPYVPKTADRKTLREGFQKEQAEIEEVKLGWDGMNQEQILDKRKKELMGDFDAENEVGYAELAQRQIDLLEQKINGLLSRNDKGSQEWHKLTLEKEKYVNMLKLTPPEARPSKDEMYMESKLQNTRLAYQEKIKELKLTPQKIEQLRLKNKLPEALKKLRADIHDLENAQETSKANKILATAQALELSTSDHLLKNFKTGDIIYTRQFSEYPSQDFTSWKIAYVTNVTTAGGQHVILESADGNGNYKIRSVGEENLWRSQKQMHDLFGNIEYNLSPESNKPKSVELKSTEQLQEEPIVQESNKIETLFFEGAAMTAGALALSKLLQKNGISEEDWNRFDPDDREQVEKAQKEIDLQQERIDQLRREKQEIKMKARAEIGYKAPLSKEVQIKMQEKDREIAAVEALMLKNRNQQERILQKPVSVEIAETLVDAEEEVKTGRIEEYLQQAPEPKSSWWKNHPRFRKVATGAGMLAGAGLIASAWLGAKLFKKIFRPFKITEMLGNGIYNFFNFLEKSLVKGDPLGAFSDAANGAGKFFDEKMKKTEEWVNKKPEKKS